jgi:hypothetical protein
MMTRQILIRPKEKGGIVSALLTLAFIGSIIFFLVKIAPIYYRYFELSNRFEATARMYGAGDYNQNRGRRDVEEKIREKLSVQLSELQIPAEPEEIIIERFGDSLRIELSYSVPLYLSLNLPFEFPLFDRQRPLYTFHFSIIAEGD